MSDHPGGASASLSDRLAAMLAEQIEALEREGPVTEFSEARVKALVALSKALEGMEDSRRRSGGAEHDEPEDIVDFRRRLERQIAALERKAARLGLPGEPA